MSTNRDRHIRLTSHPGHRAAARHTISWGAASARGRGPIIATVTDPGERNVIGTHGGSYALYRALAVSSGVLNPIARPDLTNTAPVVDIGPFPSWSAPDLIVSLDPWGHRVASDFHNEIAEGFDCRPTIAVTNARLTIPEFSASDSKWLEIDGTIVRSGRDIAVTKIAIDPVWYLPGIASRFKVNEDQLRRTLFEQTAGLCPELVTRPDLSVFLPPIGGATLYILGDPAALADRRRTVTCRVHDECNGSDVFGSDICTCRPYLVHGIAECVKEAQRGGAGLIVYNRKEGRALGEVTKFLVYNARKRQEGGDQAGTYFERTECVAGVQDARFQQLMPDVLHWLGITRIDRFVSMSNLKYDAIIAAGIDIVERVPIPDGLIPADARVELEAKKAAGYYAPDHLPSVEPQRALILLTSRGQAVEESAAMSLLSAAAVRQRAQEMLAIGSAGKLPNFQIAIDRLDPTAALVADVVRGNYPDFRVPLHARWRHFVFNGRNAWGEIADRRTWPDAQSRARAAFDLAIISVLLDAGAGPSWRYMDNSSGLALGRSEGLALASLRMFEAGRFSSDPRDPLRADADKIAALTGEELAKGFQASADNRLPGAEGRAGLMARLGRTLLAQPSIFATRDSPRPGGLFDHLANAAAKGTLSAPSILEQLLIHFGPIWPGRLSLGGVSLGDSWYHSAIKRDDVTDGLVPLHKLSQWLTYSLIEPIQDAGITVTNLDGLTGLAEYRNGGLFIDAGIIIPHDAALLREPLQPSSEAVVEWRALTVALLDQIAPLVRQKLGVSPSELSLSSILEGGTWSAGRKIAKHKRPDGSPPLNIISDGTVF